MSQEDGSLMDAVANSDELSIFETDTVRDMIDYKWYRFAKKQHLFGGFVHLVYIVVLILYINHTFLELQPVTGTDIVPTHNVVQDRVDVKKQRELSKIKDGEVNIFTENDPRIFPPCDIRYMVAIFCCMLYPTIYDGTQLLK